MVLLVVAMFFLLGGVSESFPFCYHSNIMRRPRYGDNDDVKVWRCRTCHRRHRTMSTHWQSSSRSWRLHQSTPSGRGSSSKSSSSSRTAWTAAGVTVSPNGFHVILSPMTNATTTNQVKSTDDDDDAASQQLFLPMAITPPDKFQDSQSATSVESLTILQLLNGVDLAGPILPPDILGRMVVFHCYDYIRHYETDPNDEFSLALCNKLLAKVKQYLPNNVTYPDAHPWFRAKVPLPMVTLDRVRFSPSTLEANDDDDDHDDAEVIVSFILDCRLIDDGVKLQIPLTITLLEQVLADLALSSSLTSTVLAASFLGIALALRYKAPLVMEISLPSSSTSFPLLTKEQLLQRFPLYRTKENLQVSSDRVSQSIERGFQVFLLSRALELARKRGDILAAAKIRAKLDDYDRLDELPTIPFQYDNEVQDIMNDDDSSSTFDSSNNTTSWQERPLQ